MTSPKPQHIEPAVTSEVSMDDLAPHHATSCSDLNSPRSSLLNSDSPTSAHANSATSQIARSQPSIVSREGWLWELFNLTVSCFSLGAVVVVLACYNNKEVPSWRYGLTLNALVSLLATLFKGTLLMPTASCIGQLAWLRLSTRPMTLDQLCAYDRASRGPWGSVRFMLGPRIFHMAILGALLTILATGLDVFFQQTISHVLEIRVDHNTSTQVAALQTMRSRSDADPRWDEPGQVITNTETAARAAYISLLQDDAAVSSTPLISCSSLNCKWTFATLSVNVQCMNATDLLGIDCEVHDETASTFGCKLTTDDNILKYALPNTSRSTSHVSLGVVPGEYIGNSSDVVQKWGQIPLILAFVPWVYFADFPWIALNFGSIHDPSIYNGHVYGEICMFYIAVNEVEASMINDTYYEHVIKEHGDISSIKDRENITQQATEGGTVYHVATRNSDVDYETSFVYEPDLVLGTRTNGSGKFEVHDGFLGGLELPLIENGFFDGVVGNSDRWINNVFERSQNVTQTLINMAAAMSCSFRQNATEDLYFVNGESSSPHQIISVAWAWLALPAICLALALCFTAVAMAQSKARDIGLWKTSPLTLLFHADIDSEDKGHLHEKMGLLNSEDGMEDVARELSADLIRDKRRTKTAIKISEIQ